MFFWMMLASLMGIVAFGNLHEKTKPQEDFVYPVFQAMALSMYQQHVAAEYGYLAARRSAQAKTADYLNKASDGITPLIVAANNAFSGINTDNSVFPFIQGYLPNSYKPQNGTRSYMFCIDKRQLTDVKCDLRSSGSLDAGDVSDIVKYIVTVRAVPSRYDGASKMLALRAVSNATGNSRFVGMVQKGNAPLTKVSTTEHQPLGASHYILSSGIAPINSVYLPNYITCNFPLNNTGDKTLQDDLKSHTYLVALSLLGGLEPHENLPAGTEGLCDAVKFDAATPETP